LTGLDFHQLDFFEWFHRLISDPPLPRFSQRDSFEIDQELKFRLAALRDGPPRDEQPIGAQHRSASLLT
jgi:hypothetical protein